MGIISFFEKTINTVATSIKNIFAPSSVTETKNVGGEKENVPMVSKSVQDAQKNEDVAEIKQTSANKVYKQIEEICSDYRMSMEDVRKTQLLEGIIGCTTEELGTKPQSEINNAIKALKFVLKWQSWKFPWQNRETDDIEWIKKKANGKYIALESGRSCASEFFRISKSIRSRLKDKGYSDLTKENIKHYFNGILRDKLKNNVKGNTEAAYAELKELYGDMLNDAETAEEKEMVTAAISELKADSRAKAAELALASCSTDTMARSCVAKGIAENYVDITCKADALGERTSQDDSISISMNAFKYMGEADALQALSASMGYSESLRKKLDSGESLTPDEQYYLESARNCFYAGSVIGSSCNMTEGYCASTVINQINNDIISLNIQDEVYGLANEYIYNYADSLPITPEEFTNQMNTITGGIYTQVLKGEFQPHTFGIDGSSTPAVNTVIKHTGNTSTNGADTGVQNNGDESQNKTDDVQKKMNEKSNSNYDNKGISETDKKSGIDNADGTTETINPDNVPSPKSEGEIDSRAGTEELSPTNRFVKKPVSQNLQKQAEFIERQKAIQEGVTAVRQYAKDNNVDLLDLAIESLNSSTASHTVKKWALEQYKMADNSQQLLNFNKLTNGESATAVALNMDEETRSKIKNFRSYYIKKDIERLEEQNIS